MASRRPFLFLFLFVLLWCAEAIQLVPPPTRLISPGDLAVLFDVRRSLRDLPGSHFFSTWRFDSPPAAAAAACSSFAGVVCGAPTSDHIINAALRVTSLTLGDGAAASPGLAGTLPPSLANLTALSQLVLAPGRVAGPIPAALGGSSALRLLSLSRNLLSGPIPASFAAVGALPSLHTLDLGHNRLAGPVPDGLLALPSLRVLVLSANGGLSGSIPAVPGQLLLHLDLRGNNFTGGIPRPLPRTLRYLSLSGNAMSGPLDALDAAFPDLAFLDLSMNAFFGPVPAALLAPRRPPEAPEEVPPPLAVLLLQRNNLSGSIPAPPAGPAAVSGWTVDLSHNRLTGSLPAGLAAAGSLFVNSNRLTGAVPSEFSRSVYGGSMRTLYAQHNYLTGFDSPLPVSPGPGNDVATPPLPDGVTVCLSYNCMVPPPVGPPGCPASSSGEGSRPPYQCPAFNNGTGAVVTGGGGGDLSWDDREP